MHLEIISRKPKLAVKNKPKIVFVHGICVGAWIWDEFFLPYFAENGFEAHAMSLRGHGKSDGKAGILTWSLADYASDLDTVIESLQSPVVVVGHSLGGAVVQNWLSIGRMSGRAVGAALLASVPPWGLSYSAMRMAMLYPDLFQEIARMFVMGTSSVNKDIMSEALFSERTSDAVFSKFWKHLGDESIIASAQVQGLYPFAPLPWVKRPPIFVGGAVDDKFIPSCEIERTANYYKTQPVLAKDLAHSMMVDANWQNMAKPLLSWVKRLKGLTSY